MNMNTVQFSIKNLISAQAFAEHIVFKELSNQQLLETTDFQQFKGN